MSLLRPATFIMSLVLCVVPLICAAEPEAPKSLEEQIKYLEGALSESLRARDLKMLDLTVKGFAATKLAGKDLELSVLRAERDAAWNQQAGMMATPAPSLEAWGLLARAKLGNEQALADLRKLGSEVPPIPPPLPKFDPANQADYHAKQKALTEFGVQFRRFSHALLALALLNEPGVAERALATIEHKPEVDQQFMAMGMFGGNSDPLLLAALYPDPEAGLKKLVAYCADDKFTVKDQATVLGELSGLLSPRGNFGVDEKFSIVEDIRQKLPNDAQQALLAPYVSLLKRYTPDPKLPWDPSINQLSNFAFTIPDKTLTPEGLDAIEALVGKLPGPREQYPKQSFIAILKKNGRDNPVKPPKPPDDKF